MSLTLAKLRALQRQAGRAEAEVASAPEGKANLPQPLFSKEGRPADASATESHREVVGHDAVADTIQKEPAFPNRDASAPLFGKEGLGEIRSSHTSVDTAPLAAHPLTPTDTNPSRDASAPLFGKEGLGEIRSSHTSVDTAPLAAHPRTPTDTSPSRDASAPLFGKEGLGEIRSSRTDIDALRRLIALRERKPGATTAPANAATAAQTSPARTFPRSVPTHSGNASPTPNSNLRVLPAERSLPGEEIAPGLHLIQAHLPLPAPAQSLPLAFAKRPDDALDPRRLLFFDTETTGLAGGTGTRAFMIGAADWYHDRQLGDGLRIRQLMISTLSAEPAMLRAFAQWIEPGTVLSSYNGRCYDTPLLNTRYRLARIANPLSGLDHVDLLFPTRRMYRGVWENCRLATMERELLHIVREDDLPGSQAPAAWLHYLRGGSSALLRRVAAHNHQDVVTLAQLMLKLIEAYDERALASA
ncbi:ribonuclease H-like domain-containing protein [Lysobacter capsici]|uniref:ribonuclease H-like domain-containing protein n=1 Tax=Lysobacter capsici TaxID=435897 RepID=UPI0009EA507E|nr:ribonuclease H-like domain-containing protein [Lysobacter capsici]